MLAQLRGLRGPGSGRELDAEKIFHSLPWGWNPPILLFILGCLIFTVDGFVKVCETGWTFHNAMYACGSLIFEIGCFGFLDFDACSECPRRALPIPDSPNLKSYSVFARPDDLADGGYDPSLA